MYALQTPLGGRPVASRRSTGRSAASPQALAPAALRRIQNSRGATSPHATGLMGSSFTHNALRAEALKQGGGRKGVCRPARGLRQGANVKALFGGIDKMFKSDPSDKTKQKYESRVAEINAMEPMMQKLSDDELKMFTDTLKKRAVGGEDLESLLPEAFAVVREASTRVLGLRPFDVQLMGGMILNEGQVAEMRTGEGKTLVSVLPAYLNALAGKGVHVVTVNDYLARRDCEWVGQVHRFLGLSVGLVQQGMEDEERQKAYNCDVTYVTNSELGFDYLRDNLSQEPGQLVLRDFNFCVIDEVDSILIDEARTPLIISGQAEKPSDMYIKAAKIAEAFGRDVHYTVDEKQKNILLKEEGYEDAENLLGITDLYDPKTQWASYLINAIKAKELQIKDVNYIVRGGEVVIVDEFTGRVMPGRRWSDGLHQAVEAKEGMEIQNETVTLASISYQNFFLSYPKLGGMTGTAQTEVKEFNDIYNLSVAVVPANRDVKREDCPDVVFRTESGKWNAIATEIKRMHKTGRPVLVGTTSVERSEYLAAILDEAEVPYQLLNAKPENVERESEIVAQSGRLGSVTIATNMAGRGTDILLGGNAEFMARLKLREWLFPKVVAPAEAGDVAFETKASTGKTWAVSPSLYPCPLSDEAVQLAEDAVNEATRAWGGKVVPELEAEERLNIACEKAPTEDPALLAIRKAFKAIEGEYEAETKREKEEVLKLGGLHVVGSERHESRRVDNQLRGRSGRQGDPGSTRYFLSLEDNIFRIFGGDRIKGMMTAFRVEDLPIESKMLTNSLDEAQKKVETYFYDIRKQLFEYDAVVNSQRNKVYAERKRALFSESLTDMMVEYAEQTVDDILEANVDPAIEPEEWDLESLAAKMKQYCYLLEDLTPESLMAESGGDREKLRTYLRKRGVDAYYTKVKEIEDVEEGLMFQAERFFVLSQTDNLWKEHLMAIKFLQQAVGLRGYAQKDPLIEYKLEGYNLFLDMMAQIRRNVIYSCYQFKPVARMDQGGLKQTEEEAAAAAQGGGGDKAMATAGGGGGGGQRQKKKGRNRR